LKETKMSRLGKPQRVPAAAKSNDPNEDDPDVAIETLWKLCNKIPEATPLIRVVKKGLLEQQAQIYSCNFTLKQQKAVISDLEEQLDQGTTEIFDLEHEVDVLNNAIEELEHMLDNQNQIIRELQLKLVMDNARDHLLGVDSKID